MILKDLDLAKLRDFMAPYAPENQMERSALYVNFLKEVLGITSITPDHIFSCFSHMKEKLPVAFGQHLIDTRARKKWIDFTTGDDIVLTTVGLNHINFDMKKVDAE